MNIDDTLIIEQAEKLAYQLGEEAAYQLAADPERSATLYAEDRDDWYQTYGPVYAPLSGKSGGLTEAQIRRELGLTGPADSDLLDAVFNAFEESFMEGWYDQLLSEARGDKEF